MNPTDPTAGSATGSAVGQKAPDVRARYVAAITIRIAFDAATADEALAVTRQMEETLSIPTPRGRSAEITSTDTRVTRLAARP